MTGKELEGTKPFLKNGKGIFSGLESVSNIQNIGVAEVKSAIQRSATIVRSSNDAIISTSLEGVTETAHDATEQYRLLFEANPIPMWVFDRETLHFIAVNDAAVIQYG